MLILASPDDDGARRLVVSRPLDGRSQWYSVAPNLTQFLARYFAANGEKYWELG